MFLDPFLLIEVKTSCVQPPHVLFSQPRPKRCATHCYIARNIHYHQQFTKMNPFWPAAAGSASLYGAKAACNLNVVPPTELQGSFSGRGVNTVPDKGQGLAIFPSHSGKDGKSSQPATIMDAAQRKQVLLQQALPPGAPSNILVIGLFCNLYFLVFVLGFSLNNAFFGSVNFSTRQLLSFL